MKYDIDIVCRQDMLALVMSEDAKVKTSNRMNYEAQVEVIKKQIGGLEAVRSKLNLSQRKMSQLLLVDPSAWSRWVHGGEKAPPHIYRALQWYLTLQDQIPGLNSAYFLQKDTELLKREFASFAESQVKGIAGDLLALKEKTHELVHHSSKDILKLEEEIVILKSEIFSAHQELLNSKKNHLNLQKNVNHFGLVLLAITVFCLVFAFFKSY